MHRSCLVGFGMFLGWSLSAGALSSQAPDEAKSEILVLGTYHFANPGLDIVQTQVADILSAEKA
jgi:hypothetical protein